MLTDFFAKILFSAPLLFVGILMTLDPVFFTSYLGKLAQGINAFNHRLQGFPQIEQRIESKPVGGSSTLMLAFRLGGVLVSLAALFHLA